MNVMIVAIILSILTSTLVYTQPGEYYKYHSSRANNNNVRRTSDHPLLRGDVHQTAYKAEKGSLRLGESSVAVYSNARHLIEIITECDSTVLVHYQTEEQYGISNIKCSLADGTSYSVPGLTEEEIRSKRNAVANGETELVLPPGSRVNRATANIVLLRGTSVSFKDTDSTNLSRRRSAITGVRRVLVVRIIAADGQTTFTEQQLSNAVFGTSGDPVNLKSQYSACSYNQLRFEPVTNLPGVVDGTLTLTVSTTIGQGNKVMENDITTALNAKFGVSNPGQLADHILYCLPPGALKVKDKDGKLVDGVAYGYTSVGSWLTVYNNRWCTSVSAQAHEVGHNLNLAHSGEGDLTVPGNEYRDSSGYMGFSYDPNTGGDDSPKMCFNGPRSWKLGWYSDRHATFTYNLGVSTTINLIGASNYLSATGNDVVVIKLDASVTDYYITCNRRSGVNSETQRGIDQVMITHKDYDDNYDPSILVAELNALETYTILNFDGMGDVIVTVDDIDTSGDGCAQITITNAVSDKTEPPTTPPTPKNTPPPTSALVTPTPTPFVPKPTPPPSTPTPPPSPQPTTRKPTRPPTEKSKEPNQSIRSSKGSKLSKSKSTKKKKIKKKKVKKRKKNKRHDTLFDRYLRG